MYLRVDPSKSAAFTLYVLDTDDDLTQLKRRTQLDCVSGGLYNIESPELLEHQTITCINTGTQIFTIIYEQ